nr:retrovirus-related Pol polyprotein from transposon 17.6 [Tanacetum cinerariifolium]
MTIQSGLKAKILEVQGEASKDLKAPVEWLRGLERHFEKWDDGGVYFFDRIWISSIGSIRKLIMDEAHTLRYSIHPGVDKMYYDLRDLYWWHGMKRDIAEYALDTKLNMSTTYHPETDGQSEHTIQTLKDMLRACVMDFGGSWDTHLPLVEFSYNNSYHKNIKCVPFEALYGRLFEIMERVGRVAYRLKLPHELSCIHDTFHVSNLKKCLSESDAYIPLEEIKVDENLRFIEEPIKIVERDVKKLNQRRIPLVKVRWNSR